MRRTQVLDVFPAGDPYGSRPAEECAARCRERGLRVTVVMDLDRDAFLVVSLDADADGDADGEAPRKAA
ncbi:MULTISPECIES: hypothetical protein [unclassified Streptomyces]|uniref:hypothetical protein n=1 Tax=unclassified Streptomyces TaxID=2593676 RepID=UPI000449B4AD|nr:hypothetical protein [Streptomyces sp. PCS3-D2]WKV73346.1 hypothetical protein AW27_018555 [Streptomyces sp. PCS3-D2]